MRQATIDERHFRAGGVSQRLVQQFLQSRCRAPTLDPMTYSELRASDAERERVVAFLREHALLGRLTDDELEDRIGLAYASVTVGDLEKLIGDLPRANHPSRRPSPGRPSATRHHGSRPAAMRHHHRHRPPPPALIGLGIGALLVSGVGVALLVTVVAIAVALLAVVFAASMVLGPLLLVALLVIAIGKRHHRRPSSSHWRPTF
ncbi:MAG TPA: DUF1707 domain-containing protein [Solirubrobacter sp.]